MTTGDVVYVLGQGLAYFVGAEKGMATLARNAIEQEVIDHFAGAPREDAE